MESACFSKVLVYTDQTARRYKPEDFNLNYFSKFLTFLRHWTVMAANAWGPKKWRSYSPRQIKFLSEFHHSSPFATTRLPYFPNHFSPPPRLLITILHTKVREYLTLEVVWSHGCIRIPVVNVRSKSWSMKIIEMSLKWRSSLQTSHIHTHTYIYIYRAFQNFLRDYKHL